MAEFHLQVQFKDYQLSDETKYFVEVKSDPTHGNYEEQGDVLDVILSKLTERPEAIKTSRLFDELYCFCRKLDKLKVGIKKAIVSVLVKGLETLIYRRRIEKALRGTEQDFADYRSSARMYIVLISQVRCYLNNIEFGILSRQHKTDKFNFSLSNLFVK